MATGTPTRIGLVVEHRLLRESFGVLLRDTPDVSLIFQSGSLDQAPEELRPERADLILVYLDNHPVNKTFEALQKLIELRPGVRFVVVSSEVAEADAVRLARLGVAGILLKDAGTDLLSKCIQKVMAGELWYDQPFFQAILRSVAGYPPKEPRPLTNKELDVLVGLVSGLSNKQIATRLSTRESAVKGVLQGLFQKTGARSRSQLVRIALEEYRDQIPPA